MVPDSRAVVGIALLLALAGCAGVGLGGPSQPADVPDPRNASVVPESGNYRVDWVVTANQSGPALSEDVNETVWVGRTGEPSATLVTRRGDPDGARTTYVTDVREFARNPVSGEALAYRYDAGGVDLAVPTRMEKATVGAVLRLGSFDYRGTVERDGRTLHRFVADGAAVDRVRDYEATVLLTADGWVADAEGSYVNERTAQRIAFDWRVAADVGVPERPAWTERVPNLTMTLADGGDYAVVEGVGGAALAADRTLQVRVFVDGESVTREVTLDEPLGPGDALYVWAVDGDGGVTVAVARSPPGDGTLALTKATALTTDRESPTVALETASRGDD